MKLRPKGKCAPIVQGPSLLQNALRLFTEVQKPVYFDLKAEISRAIRSLRSIAVSCACTWTRQCCLAGRSRMGQGFGLPPPGSWLLSSSTKCLNRVGSFSAGCKPPAPVIQRFAIGHTFQFPDLLRHLLGRPAFPHLADFFMHTADCTVKRRAREQL